MGRFLIKAAFGSEVLIRRWRSAYLRTDACKRKCAKAEDSRSVIKRPTDSTTSTTSGQTSTTSFFVFVFFFF